MRVLGKLFRRLFLTRLVALRDNGRLAYCGSLAHLDDRRAFLRHLAPVRKKRWVVYAKPPFAGPENVLAGLTRKTHLDHVRQLLEVAPQPVDDATIGPPDARPSFRLPTQGCGSTPAPCPALTLF